MQIGLSVTLLKPNFLMSCYKDNTPAIADILHTIVASQIKEILLVFGLISTHTHTVAELCRADVNTNISY